VIQPLTPEPQSTEETHDSVIESTTSDDAGKEQKPEEVQEQSTEAASTPPKKTRKFKALFTRKK
jgi:hypothetical protein